MLKLKYVELDYFKEKFNLTYKGNILFNSNINKWGMITSEFYKLISNHSSILIVIETTEEKRFGCYIDTTITEQGKSIEEIMQWAEVEVDKFATYFYADNLKFFKLSGRVSNFSAIMGNIIGIHPILQ